MQVRVRFHWIEYRNILSVGNTPIRIELDQHETTLICGLNGDGKSTLLDAIYFLLFGKPYRDIVKNHLINEINERDLLVEGELSIGSTRYKIVRGLKPAIFEIYENGILLPQNAASKEYQDTLETVILKMNEKSFRQIIILGSADYIPFMKLRLSDRREVIEDLLDISIFSAMNKVVKLRFDDLKSKLNQVDTEINLLQNQKGMLAQFIQTQQQRAEQSKTISEASISEKETLVSDKLSQATKLVNEKSLLEEVLKEHPKTVKKLADFQKIQIKFEESIRNTNQIIDFYEQNDTCPTCKQGIAHDHKTQLIGKATESKSNYEKLLADLQTNINSTEKQKSKFDALKNTLDQKVTTIEKLKGEIAIYNQQIEQLRQQTVKSDVSDQILADIDKLKKLDETVAQKTQNRSLEFENKQYLEDVKELLKDTGIKTSIIRHYMPIINKTINQHIHQLGLHVKFALDETFSESINRNGHDKTYSSFSEGEKGRINLAIMFSWRHIAALKNSSNTNLLIMDETFDSSLDAEATEELLNLINQISSENNTNIFVISHKNSDMLYDRFKHVIKFKKVNRFTRIEHGNV